MRVDVTPPEGRKIVITMTEHEAGLLRGICHRIGGSPQGDRGVFDAVNAALGALGVEATGVFETSPCSGIYFRS